MGTTSSLCGWVQLPQLWLWADGTWEFRTLICTCGLLPIGILGPLLGLECRFLSDALEKDKTNKHVKITGNTRK